jgi:glutamine synthetase
LEIWDAAGRLIRRWEAMPIPGDNGNGMHVDVSDLKDGVYVLTDGQGAAGRLVIQR